MRTPYSFAGPLFLAITFASLALFVALAAAAFGPEHGAAAAAPSYHFAVITDNEADHARAALRRGCLRAGSEYGVAIEFFGPRFTDNESQLSWLETAVAAKVDGIAVQVPDQALFAPVIDRAVERGIPVVTVEDDAKDSRRGAFVGASNFAIGSRAGALAASASGGRSRIVQIIPEELAPGRGISSDLELSGFREAVKASPGMRIDSVLYSRLGIFSAEEAAQDIVFNRPSIDLIVCYSASDTIGVAQVLIDYNRVGRILVVGFGDDPEIARYVEKGVVAGSVVVDADDMGYRAVATLVSLAKGQRASSFVEIGVRSLDRAAVEAGRDLSGSDGKSP
jgi:ribose transport system substrate-binding protein